MITRSFIEKIHYYLDELNYHPYEFSIDEYSSSVAKTLSHCATLEDAKNAILIGQFMIKQIIVINIMIEYLKLEKEIIYGVKG